MSRLPLIVGFGGVNPAGRSSFHHAYRRLVIDALPTAVADRTLQSLAALMKVGDELQGQARRDYILAHTLIRKIERSAFDVEQVPWNRRMQLQGERGAVEFVLRRKQLPEALPDNWQIRDLGDDRVAVTVAESVDVLLPTHRRFEVSSAGQLPTGFDPAAYYPARNHPRGLQMSVFGASDALQSVGIDICKPRG